MVPGQNGIDFYVTGIFPTATLGSKTAPEFSDIEGWINSEPLTLEGLRGKVVFLDFWTYGCINCVRTLPYVKELHSKFSPLGLVVVGVHTPEFPSERKRENVERAVAAAGLAYPIALDGRDATWKLYGNHYWPRQTFVDSKGVIRYEHVGEGDYEEMESVAARLLEEVRISRAQVGADPARWSQLRTRT